MAQVLVAYAGKMGGTREIAEAVGRSLTQAGCQVDVCDAAQVGGLNTYDGIVIGSALYAGRWRRPAVRLLRRLAGNSVTIPVWLFHSGPCGENARHQSVPAPSTVRTLAARINATIQTFGGRLTPDTARGFIAKKMARGPMAGDFRDFEQIRNWAADIGVALLVDAHRPSDATP